VHFRLEQVYPRIPSFLGTMRPQAPAAGLSRLPANISTASVLNLTSQCQPQFALSARNEHFGGHPSDATHNRLSWPMAIRIREEDFARAPRFGPIIPSVEQSQIALALGA
jgi:hypothetical protein